MQNVDKKTLAYIVGIALGDGNLSNPNGRAPRLRITCCTYYPNLIENIKRSIQILLPNNKVSIVNKPGNCLDISCYSTKWEGWLGWKANGGSKCVQNIGIPKWIISEKEFYTPCLLGLLQSDGSVYRDRGYTMVNFVTSTPQLAKDTHLLIEQLGFIVHLYKAATPHRPKYTLRVSKNTEALITKIGFTKN